MSSSCFNTRILRAPVILLMLAASLVGTVSTAAKPEGDVVDSEDLDRELVRAARKQGLPEIRRALDAGARIDATDEQGRTALMFAAYRDQIRTLELLIQRDAKLDLRGSRGFTALMYAAYRGNRSAALRLLEAGADYRLKNDAGQTALDVALKENQVSFRRTLRTEFLGTRLFAATMRRDHAAMSRLLTDGADPNVRVDGVPVILAAVRNADPAAIRLLLSDSRANHRVLDEQGRDLLAVAIEIDERDRAPVANRFAYPLARELLRYGFRRGARSAAEHREEISELLAKAEDDRGADRLQLLLNTGQATLRVKAGAESAALQCARQGNYRYLYLLLQSGNYFRDMKPLMATALQNDDARLMRATLASLQLNGDEVVSITPTRRWLLNLEPLREDFLDHHASADGPALVKAVALKRPDVLRFLLRHPPSDLSPGDRSWMNQATPDGRSAVHHAFALNRLDMLRALLAAGADINHANRYGTTILLRAVHSSHTKRHALLAELIALGADPNRQGMHGRTALWWAARLGREDAVAMLLNAGAVANPVDDYGVSALQEATGAGHTLVVELIESKLRKSRATPRLTETELKADRG